VLDIASLSHLTETRAATAPIDAYIAKLTI
jgi:hypothetical protein